MIWKSLDTPYLDCLKLVRSEGILEMDRTGTGCYSLPGSIMARYNLYEGFPLFTHKKIGFVGIVRELMWFLSGSTNAKVIEDLGVNIWRQWGGEDRKMGPIYGDGWRNFSVNSPAGDRVATVDQLKWLLTALVKDPTSRRHVVTLWNPHTWKDCALACCHGTTIQFKRQANIDGQEYLHCSMTQRSNDLLLGVPWNVASYALLTCLIASWLGIQPGILSHTMNDAHIYQNHLDQVDEVLARPLLVSPKLKVTWGEGRIEDVDAFLNQIKRILITGYYMEKGDSEDSVRQLSMCSDSLEISLMDYNPHPAIKAPVAV